MIKAIIFDIGGVLLTEQFYPIIETLCAETGSDYEEVRAFVRPIFHEEVMTGVTSELGMWQQVIEHFRWPITPQEIWDRLGSTYQRIDKVWDYIEQLKGDYRLAILSNLGLESITHREDNYQLSKHFEIILYSAEHGLKKPDPAFYQKALDLLKADPTECIFIDDKPRNIEAANALGIHGIVFETPEQLAADFARLGVEVN